VFNDLRWEVVVSFIDIDGIADHPLLSLLSLMYMARHKIRSKVQKVGPIQSA
jgi:hypothetical protein